ncbi:MAG: hypothetical protein ACPG0K_03740 [Flavobacteriaceae bacterium]|jgi:hypothetical protein
MRLKNYIYFFLFILIGCSGSSGGGETPEPPPPPPAPTVAVLKTPAQNSECLDGENVEFSWNASQNTDSYTIVVKNLLTTAQISQTTTSTSVTIKLDVGQPYSWFITSSSSVSSQTASTTKWKFYLKGDPTSNYAPFPADLISPKSESNVNVGNVKFEWKGSDVDENDTLKFDLYVDTENPPTTRVKSNLTSNSSNLNLDSGTYYWKVITKDDSGSNSDSGVSMFKVVE